MFKPGDKVCSVYDTTQNKIIYTVHSFNPARPGGPTITFEEYGGWEFAADAFRLLDPRVPDDPEFF